MRKMILLRRATVTVAAVGVLVGLASEGPALAGAAAGPPATGTPVGPVMEPGPVRPAPSSGTVAEERSGDLALLRAELTRLVSSGVGSRGSWGILAIAPERGDTLFALNHDAAFAPASNQKLFTSAAALHHLGPDFSFSTFLLADGPVVDGVLRGDLILYGTGDPALSDRLLDSALDPFRDFAEELEALGIHTIQGNVVGDGSYFEGPPRHPSWNPRDLNDWFAAPVAGLSFNENVVTLRIRSGPVGSPPDVLQEPHGARVHVANQARTVAAGPTRPLTLVRNRPEDPIELRGDMTAGRPDVWRRLTVRDPSAFAASALRTALEGEGIRVAGDTRSVSSRDASPVSGRTLVAPGFQETKAGPLRTLAVHRSPPLSELLKVVNRESHNLYTEALFMALGRLRSGEGSFEGGARAVTDYLVRVAGVDGEGLHVVDGSGLSHLNRASPAGLVTLLAHVTGEGHAEAFREALPEAGNPRQLRRMYRSAAAGNLRAKTGTLERVSALSGVVRSAGGETILFSVLANDLPSSWAAKRVEDRIGIQLASFQRATEAGGLTQIGEGRPEQN